METKAVVFTHLSIQKNDVEKFQNALDEGQLVELVWDRFGRIIKGIATCSSVKLAYLFLSDAYIAFITKSGDKEFTKIFQLELAIQPIIIDAIREHCDDESYKKFVVIGLTQLRPLLDKFQDLSKNMGGGIDFNKLVLGEGSRLYYDCPKFVEAIIRVARRHYQEPILRFDQDVEVNPDGVKALIDAYNVRIDRDQKYFLFSGSYHWHNKENTPEMHWLNDYAVRTHFLSSQESGSDNFRLDTVLAKHFIEDIRYIGADAQNQPISGAGLCISPMAIVQLPPFAIVSRNIIWIDDSIKRALHEGIGDIPVDDDRQVPGANFCQDRYRGTIITGQDFTWGNKDYLPRLLYGCLMYSVLEDFTTIRHPTEGPYSKFFVEYMQSKTKPTQSDREAWRKVIEKRLKVIRKQWNSSPYSDLNHQPAGKKLVEFSKMLKITNKSKIVIDEIVKNPSQDLSQLCLNNKLDNDPEKTQRWHAAWFVGSAIADLTRYMDLMDIWPYIIRTIDFEVRSRPQHSEEWLIRYN
ncbi:MAG: hypothetical protein LUQ26_15195 [Methylococcaceae bacterium]|nr:hypothetical protein [Methylococcaceae bacterium]